jgi:hypothetical protein
MARQHADLSILYTYRYHLPQSVRDETDPLVGLLNLGLSSVGQSGLRRARFAPSPGHRALWPSPLLGSKLK